MNRVLWLSLAALGVAVTHLVARIFARCGSNIRFTRFRVSSIGSFLIRTAERSRRVPQSWQYTRSDSFSRRHSGHRSLVSVDVGVVVMTQTQVSTYLHQQLLDSFSHSHPL